MRRKYKYQKHFLTLFRRVKNKIRVDPSQSVQEEASLPKTVMSKMKATTTYR
jgi:hypothetical protein